MKIIERTTVEMEDGAFSALIHETDGELEGFTLEYQTEHKGKVWMELRRADLVGLIDFLGKVLAEADAVPVD